MSDEKKRKRAVEFADQLQTQLDEAEASGDHSLVERLIAAAALPTTAAEARRLAPSTAINIASIRDQVPLPVQAPRRLVPDVAPVRVPKRPTRRALDRLIRDVGLERPGDRWWAVRRMMSWPAPEPQIDAALQSAMEDEAPSVAVAAAMAAAARRALSPGVALDFARRWMDDSEYGGSALLAAVVAAAWDRRPRDVDEVQSLLRDAEKRAASAPIGSALLRQLALLPPEGEPSTVFVLGSDE